MLGQVSRKRGIISGTDVKEGWFTIIAEIPLNEMFGYSGELRSSTQGKGEFSMEYARYSPCMPEVQEQLVNQYLESQGISVARKSKN